MSAQGTGYLRRTSIQGETTHNAHTGPGREVLRGHSMRGVCTRNMKGGGRAPHRLDAGRRERQKVTHTCTHTMARHMLTGHGTTHTGHTSQRGYTWPHKTREAGGSRGMGAGHTNMNAWENTISTQGTAHSTATQRGGKVGRAARAANQSGNTAERKQKTVPFVCTHTSKEKTTHQVCDRAEGGEGCVWVWVVGDGTCAVLGRLHYRHHRATGLGWDGGRG